MTWRDKEGESMRDKVGRRGREREGKEGEGEREREREREEWGNKSGQHNERERS